MAADKRSAAGSLGVVYFSSGKKTFEPLCVILGVARDGHTVMTSVPANRGAEVLAWRRCVGDRLGYKGTEASMELSAARPTARAPGSAAPQRWVSSPPLPPGSSSGALTARGVPAGRGAVGAVEIVQCPSRSSPLHSPTSSQSSLLLLLLLACFPHPCGLPGCTWSPGVYTPASAPAL